MKMFFEILFGMGLLSVSTVSLAQNSNMMNQGTWNSGWMGGFGGMWVWVLLCNVVLAFVVWILARKGK